MKPTKNRVSLCHFVTILSFPPILTPSPRFRRNRPKPSAENRPNFCQKSPQIDAENLVNSKKCRTFAVQLRQEVSTHRKLGPFSLL